MNSARGIFFVLMSIFCACCRGADALQEPELHESEGVSQEGTWLLAAPQGEVPWGEEVLSPDTKRNLSPAVNCRLF